MICPNCGKTIPDSTKFCPECGASVANNGAPVQPKGFEFNNQQANYQNNYQRNASYLLNVTGIQRRDILFAVLFTFITCGIYGIYWFIVLTDETNQITNQPDATSGGLAFVFSLITCSIYYFYWSYKMGEKVDIMKGNPNGSTSVLFLVLSIFGLGFINYILAQDAINSLVTA